MRALSEEMFLKMHGRFSRVYNCERDKALHQRTWIQGEFHTNSARKGHFLVLV